VNRLDNRPGHAPALFRAAAAFIGAALAVFVLVLFALVAAVFADIAADPANIVHEFGAPAHECRRLPAQGRAVPIQTNAIRHGPEVVLFETRRGTMLAGLRATHARIDTRLQLFIRHGNTPVPEK
jgi:hypothetical protein